MEICLIANQCTVVISHASAHAQISKTSTKMACVTMRYRYIFISVNLENLGLDVWDVFSVRFKLHFGILHGLIHCCCFQSAIHFGITKLHLNT